LETNFEAANLTGYSVYEFAAWNINLVEARQSDLVITRFNEPDIAMDNLEVAQFIYLLLHWCIRKSSPRIWTFNVAKFVFPPWHVARRMPPQVRALRRLL
jgi:hypothetical protein